MQNLTSISASRENIQYYRNKDGHRPYKKFEKILTTRCGYVCWESGAETGNKFNIANHIRTLNAKQIFNSTQLQELLSEFSKDMEETRPQWEIVIIPRYDGKGKLTRFQFLSLFNSNFLNRWIWHRKIYSSLPFSSLLHGWLIIYDAV